jgi:hypothetical protein
MHAMRQHARHAGAGARALAHARRSATFVAMHFSVVHRCIRLLPCCRAQASHAAPQRLRA